MKRLLLILVTLSLLACSSKKEAKNIENAEKVTVSVVNYPLYYFSERIGGDYFEIMFPIPKDVDPAYWVPDSESLTIFQKSDLIFTNGANYAKWLNNVSLPARNMINTSASISDKYIEVQEGASHSHGAEGEHVHTGYAFTTWLNFEIAIEQAKKIKNELVKLKPEKAGEFEKNFVQLETELLSLHKKLKEISLGNDLIASHPVYQYLSAAYKLNIQSVHFEPDEMPSPENWDELEHLLDHHSSAIMIWENEPMDEIKEELMKRKINFLVFNPCGNKPDQGDFMSVMTSNLERLKSIPTENK